MCGIAGAYSTRLYHDEIQNAKTLIWLASLRGRDSTGLMAAWRNKKGVTEMDVLKRAVTADELINSSEANKKIFNLPGMYLLAGHCRLATVGEINEANAHPIVSGDIVGVHNGQADAFKKEAKARGVSDSTILYERISKNGLKEALTEANSSELAFALQFVDLQKRTLSFIRNMKRPLAFMFNHNESTLYWASEACMLELLRSRVGSREFSSIEVVPPNTLYTVGLGSLEFEVTPINIEPPTKTFKMGGKHFKEVEPKLLLPTLTEYKGSVPSVPPKASETLLADRLKTASLNSLEKWREKQKEAAAKKQSDSSKIPSGHSYIYLGWKGNVVDISELITRLKKGCTHCTQVSQLSDTNEKPAHWISRTAYICDDCRDTEFVAAYIKNSEVYTGELVIGN